MNEMKKSHIYYNKQDCALEIKLCGNNSNLSVFFSHTVRAYLFLTGMRRVFFFVLFHFSLHPLDHFPNSTFLTVLNDYEKFPFTVVWFHWLKEQATCSTIGSYHVNKYGVCEQRYSDHERPLRLLCVKVNEVLDNT